MELTANDKILDGIVRNQVYMMQFANNMQYASSLALRESEKELRLLILDYASRMEGVQSYSAKAKRLYDDLQRKIFEIRYAIWDDIIKEASSNYKRLATIEQEAANNTIVAALPVVVALGMSAASDLAEMVGNLPIRGETLRQALVKAKRADTARIMERFKAGIADRLGVNDIVATTIGTKPMNYKDGVVRRSFSSLQTIFRTAANAIATKAREMFFNENSLFDREIYVAVLDDRTTYQCSKLHGKVFRVGEGPIPPLHYNCRSTRSPYVSYEAIEGLPLKDSVQAEYLGLFAKENNLVGIRTLADLQSGYKQAYNSWVNNRLRVAIGKVPIEPSFETFFERQTAAFQKQYLGPTRYKLFKSGKISIDDLTNDAGRKLSINELIALIA